MTTLGSVCAVLPTPFRPDESLDLSSLRTLVGWELELGVDSVCVLGFAGEVLRLTDAEKDSVLAETVVAVNGRVPVVAGVAGFSIRSTIDNAVAAVEGGANALMVPPPLRSGAGSAEGLVSYFAEVSAAVAGTTILLQDEPENAAATMTADVIARIMNEVEAVSCAKIEEPPTAAKVAAIRSKLSRDGVALYGGRGGLELIDELAAGSAGAITGFAEPDVLVEILRLWNAGDGAGAERVYRDRLPAFVFEGQKGIGLAVRKERLRRRGAISSNTVRRPGPAWRDELETNLERWDRK